MAIFAALCGPRGPRERQVGAGPNSKSWVAIDIAPPRSAGAVPPIAAPADWATKHLTDGLRAPHRRRRRVASYPRARHGSLPNLLRSGSAPKR
jgi:hypothetical protein